MRTTVRALLSCAWRIERALRLATVGLLCAVSPRASLADIPGTMPLVAAGDGHLWWVVERAPSAASGDPAQSDAPFLLMHHALDEPAPSERLVMRFAAEPEAIAAEGTHVVVVTRERGNARRMVLSMSVQQHPSSGHWVTAAGDRARIHAPLLATGVLTDLALANDVLYALLRQNDAAAGAPMSRELLALELRTGKHEWQSISLPQLDVSEPIRLLRTEKKLALLGSVDGALVTATRASNAEVGREQWERAPLVGADRPLSVRAVIGAFEVDHRLALVERGAPLAGEKQATIQLSLLRRGVMNEWAAFPEPLSPWAVAGFGPDAALLTIGFERRGSVRTIALSAAAPTEGVELAPPRFSAGKWIHIPIIAAAAVALVLLALILGAGAYLDRGHAAVRVASQIPADRRRGARLGVRAFAMLIDLAPALALSWLYFRGNPLEYLEFPVFVTDLEARMPAIATMAGAWLFASLGDVFFGRSLGKRLTGLEIIGARGEPSTLRGRALRALASLVTVAAPPVMLLAAVNPLADGPAEMVSGTAVVENSRGNSREP